MDNVEEMQAAVASAQDESVRARIAARAYELWEQRGEGHGGDVEDWLQAEREILASLSEQAAR